MELGARWKTLQRLLVLVFVEDPPLVIAAGIHVAERQGQLHRCISGTRRVDVAGPRCRDRDQQANIAAMCALEIPRDCAARDEPAHAVGHDRHLAKAVLGLKPLDQRRQMPRDSAARGEAKVEARRVEVEPGLKALAVERVDQAGELLRIAADAVHEQHGYAIGIVGFHEVDPHDAFVHEVVDAPQASRAGFAAEPLVVEVFADFTLHGPRPHAEGSLVLGRACDDSENVDRLGQALHAAIGRDEDVIGDDAAGADRHGICNQRSGDRLIWIVLAVAVAVLVGSDLVRARSDGERIASGPDADVGVGRDVRFGALGGLANENDDQRPRVVVFSLHLPVDAAVLLHVLELLLESHHLSDRRATRQQGRQRQ